jgi:ribosome-associated protein
MSEESTLDHVFACARAAVDKRGSDLVILDVSGLSSFTDYFLVVSGSSDRRVQTIAEAVIQVMKERGVRPFGVEGMRDGRWALADFGDWVVHVFYEEARGFFDLEGLWFDAKRVEPPSEVFEPADRVSQGIQP